VSWIPDQTNIDGMMMCLVWVMCTGIQSDVRDMFDFIERIKAKDLNTTSELNRV
jgi:hypothetical protein